MELRKFLKTNQIFLCNFRVKIYFDTDDGFIYVYDDVFNYISIMNELSDYEIYFVNLDFFNNICFISLFRKDNEI